MSIHVHTLLLYTDCYINLDLKSCQSYGVEGVEIKISPFGTKGKYVIDETHPHICHPMKCIEGEHVGQDVSITATAILGIVDNVELTTQPTIFQQGYQFYTAINTCRFGPANVKVTCQSGPQAGFYSLSKNNIAYMCIEKK